MAGTMPRGTMPRLFDRLGGQFPLGPMGDGPPAVARTLARQGDDRAGILGAVGGRRTGAAGHPAKRSATRLPVLASQRRRQLRTVVRADAQPHGTRLDADAFPGKQHDPGAQHHVLGASLLTDQRFEVAALTFARINRIGFVSGHGCSGQ